MRVHPLLDWPVTVPELRLCLRLNRIGDQASVPMPDTGVLYLSVNDDERADNAGEFVVVASRNPRR